MNRCILRSIGPAALIGVLIFPAYGQQKTVKQCSEEWTANKAAIQASGKTKKSFVAECRGLTPSSAAAPATPPASPAATGPAPLTGAKKTVKQCSDEWTANKASIQASGKTKKDYIAECRGVSSSIQAAPNAEPSPTATPIQPPDTAARPSASPARRPPLASPPTRTPTGLNQFASEAEARAHCPTDTIVWANLNSKIYHFSGHRSYGTTKSGAYMCEGETSAADIHAAKNEKHP
jgi:hypothetical protein